MLFLAGASEAGMRVLRVAACALCSASLLKALPLIPAYWFEELFETPKLRGAAFGEPPKVFGSARGAALFAALTVCFRISGLPPIFTALLLLIAAGDARYRIISDHILLGLSTAALLCSLELQRGLLSASGALAFPVLRIVCALAFPAVWIICALAADLAGSELPVGFGDAKLMFALSLLMGPADALRSLTAGSLACGAVSAALLLTGKASKKDPIAFGPFLIFGVFLVSGAG